MFNILKIYIMINYVDETLFNNNNLPDKVTVSTISCTCKLNTEFNLVNINDHLKLNEDDVLTIKYNNSIKSLDPKVIKKYYQKQKKKKNRNFFNQLTIEVKTNNNRKINAKLFKNGSVQLTGCKSMIDVNVVLNKMIKRLEKVVAVLVDDNEIVEKPFYNLDKKIKMTNFDINMINSNFSVDYEINRESLYNILLTNKVTCTYEPCIHACINIKYKLDTGKVSIFVFQSGHIIITGAKTEDQIQKSYDYIQKILADNFHNIQKKKISSIFDDEEFNELLSTDIKKSPVIKAM